MIYIIIGTPQKCKDWLNGDNTADYTNYWVSQGTSITYDIDKGDITGLEGSNKAITLCDINNMPTIKNNWLLFIVDATGVGVKTINKIYFGGIVTSKPRTLMGKDKDGKFLHTVDVMASGFAYLANLLKVELPPMINQYPDIVINRIMKDFADNNLIKQGVVSRPTERLSVIRFNKERRAWSACKTIAELYPDYEFIIEPAFTPEFVGAYYNFKPRVKAYTSFRAPLKTNF